MQWSKLRALFLEHLAGELRGRIDVHSAAYKSGGRTWISFDGEEIACVQAPGFTRQVFRHSSCADLHHGQTLELGNAIYVVVHSSIEECLASDNPLVRAVAILDRRCGKRRIDEYVSSTQLRPSSFELALLTVRQMSLGSAPTVVLCEHCGEVLGPTWAPSS